MGCSGEGGVGVGVGGRWGVEGGWWWWGVVEGGGWVDSWVVVVVEGGWAVSCFLTALELGCMVARRSQESCLHLT